MTQKQSNVGGETSSFFDPIGPGTPAWNAFDRALICWCMIPVEFHNQKRNNPHKLAHKRFLQHKRQMIKFLRLEGTNEPTVQEWVKALNLACAEHDGGETNG